MTLLEECGEQMKLIHRCRIENLLDSTVNDTTDVYAADACADHAGVEALWWERLMNPIVLLRFP